MEQEASNNMAARVTNKRLHVGLKQYCDETNSSQEPVKLLAIPMN